MSQISNAVFSLPSPGRTSLQPDNPPCPPPPPLDYLSSALIRKMQQPWRAQGMPPPQVELATVRRLLKAVILMESALHQQPHCIPLCDRSEQLINFDVQMPLAIKGTRCFLPPDTQLVRFGLLQGKEKQMVNGGRGILFSSYFLQYLISAF